MKRMSAIGLDEAAYDAQARKISGIANTFRVMRSGRLIHPDALSGYLARHPEPVIQLMAQHGQTHETFGTIGVVTSIEPRKNKGLYFEASLARGTVAAEEAATLLAQGALRQVSIGWQTRQARWVTESDVDLDPWVQKQMKLAGVREALVYLAIDLCEISLVDVADDPGALLAAVAGDDGAREERIEAKLDRLLAAMTAAPSALLTVEQTSPGVIAQAVEVARATAIQIGEDLGAALRGSVAELIESKLEDLGAAYLADVCGAVDAAASDAETDGASDAPAPASKDQMIDRLRRAR